jgi:hypothetical protein
MCILQPSAVAGSKLVNNCEYRAAFLLFALLIKKKKEKKNYSYEVNSQWVGRTWTRESSKQLKQLVGARLRGLDLVLHKPSCCLVCTLFTTSQPKQRWRWPSWSKAPD